MRGDEGASTNRDESASDDVLGASTNLRLVRLQLLLALVTMAIIPIVIAAPVFYVQARGFGASLVVPTLGLLLLTAVLGGLTTWFARRVLEPAQRLERARIILEDAYDRARSESLRDGLTGLGNHRAFQEEVERQWSGATRYGQSLALAIVDLDDFKRMNDSRGHAAGDHLLRHAATVMATYLRRSDRAFRIGGDEFAIIMPGTDADGAHVTIRRLLAACLEGDNKGEEPTVASFSAGISAIPGQARDRDSLYNQADAALFWSKHHGRTCVTIYDAERHDSPITARPPAELSALVARIAATGGIRAVFQPIYDLATGAPRGFEGLVRPLPDSGFTDPGSMFVAAEATGRTVELDIACLNSVMETAARLRLPGSLAVNLSPRTLETDDFSIHELIRMIGRHGLDPRNIVVELTEREAVEDLERLRRAVEACRVAGIRVAADDVGAGNAGLRLLSQLRFDIVKIDLSLVQGGAHRDGSLEVVRTLRDLADRWGALVVAEGIETPAQLEMVRALGIGAGQGYLLGRPTDRPAIDALDLDKLTRSADWLIEALRATPA
ncbi:MAG: bifunctional diguanylate cyclase/phosphodiesterase [Chloroflexi bacterium]|nr:bifunctional diguanylate cyclase/phosphodiesterase [Chloroflexota bacterium]